MEEVGMWDSSLINAFHRKSCCTEQTKKRIYGEKEENTIVVKDAAQT